MRLIVLLFGIITSVNLMARTPLQAEIEGYRLLAEFAKTKSNEFGCFPCSVGGGFLGNKVNNLTLDLCFSKEIAVDEARALYVNLLLDLIDFVAKDKSVQPYLHHTPPSTKDMVDPFV